MLEIFSGFHAALFLIKWNKNIQFIKSFAGYSLLYCLLLDTYLFMRENVNIAFNASLCDIRPRVARHPFSLTLGTLVLAKTSFFALIWCFSFASWSCLNKCCKEKKIIQQCHWNQFVPTKQSLFFSVIFARINNYYLLNLF